MTGRLSNTHLPLRASATKNVKRKEKTLSYVKIWIHCVWGTKNRSAFLTKQNKKKIIKHILENSKEKDIYIDCINGYKDHLHCIVSLNKDQNISKVMQLIKGESSFWINKNRITQTKFEWADDYFAVSVSESQISIVRNYINNQEEHHRVKTWQEEYEAFMKKYGFTKLQG